jgi:hypothetical protein
MRPDKSGRDESAGGHDSWMAQSLEMKENLFAEGMRN